VTGKTGMDEFDFPTARKRKEQELDPDQVGLFDRPPPPPTGPLADPYRASDSRPQKFVEFFLSEEGQLLFTQLRGAALSALHMGEKRFSVRAWVDSDAHKKRINNSFCPWLADELVADSPELLGIIERRVRRKLGPPIQSTTTEKENT